LTGTGFATFLLPPPLNTVCVGICMDLNVQAPGQWVSLEKGPYEFANYCIAKRADLVILLNAWLLSDEDNENEYGSTIINYWSHRLRPLWVLDEKTDPEILGRQTNVVICNRFGDENGM
jgi:protein N-terminal amidase